MNRVAKRMLGMGARNMQSSIHAGVTIAARTPKLINASFDPFGADGHEAHVAMTEKVEAVWDGALAVQRKLSSLWLRAAFGGALWPQQWSHGWMDVADAAFKPALQKVSANAKRLTGKIGF